MLCYKLKYLMDLKIKGLKCKRLFFTLRLHDKIVNLSKLNSYNQGLNLINKPALCMLTHQFLHTFLFLQQNLQKVLQNYLLAYHMSHIRITL